MAAGLLFVSAGIGLAADDAAKPAWNYTADLLRPFWVGTVMEGESVLFVRDGGGKPAKASVIFPISQVLAVRNSAGDVTYEEGNDYTWSSGSREIVIPAGSRIPVRTPADLRRPAGTQKYKLTHRDGNGEIFFGSKLEYHEMQTCITYRHEAGQWKSEIPRFEGSLLPSSVHKLLNKQLLKIVVVGDSISAGCNASGWAESAPWQPAYPELLQQYLQERFVTKVEIHNPSVSGTDTKWVLDKLDKVVETQPDLVIVAFGMNDASGRPAAEYQKNISAIVAGISERQPNCEFILVASMPGNRDWATLQPELFPQYRDALKALSRPGVAVADLTSIWSGFLEHKQDRDLTGNGVNHPNDFGHRVYAQVLGTLLTPTGEPPAITESPREIVAGPLRLTEQLLRSGYSYSYACAAADLDGDGDLDITSADAECNNNVYLLRNEGQGRFRHSFIQKYAMQADQPVRLERHALGDVNGDGRPDVVIVDNLKWDVRWFENPGAAAISEPWMLHRVSAAKEVPGAYDVALADLDADGDLDVIASSWRFGNRFDWFENVGRPGNGGEWVRHEIDSMVGETRTVMIGDFSRDGKPDFLGTARSSNQVLWYENSGAPLSQPWKKHVVDSTTVAPAHGHHYDLDGDGDLDVVMAFGIAAPVANDSPESHQVAWYENLGSPGAGTEWRKHFIDPSFPQGFEAVAGDLDGDGDPDVVATAWGSDGRLVWYENTGNPQGDWKRHMIKTGWPMAVTVILKDFDQDGRLDIVACAERGANELRWWRNAGPAAAK